MSDPLRDAAWREAIEAARAIPKPRAAYRPGSNLAACLAYQDRYYGTLWRIYLDRYYAARLALTGYRDDLVHAARRMGVGDEVIDAALAREEAA